MSKPFILTRTVDAPRELVFDVWTKQEHLEKWFGPKGFKIVSAKLDLKPGGIFHYGMQAPDGSTMWGKWVFREIERPEKIVVESSFSDAQGGITRHPFAPSWPLQTLSTTTFTEKDGKTTMTVQWEALNATDTEQQMFDASHDSMNKGWGGTMEQLEAYLGTL